MTLYDFLYIDHDRVQSLYSQLFSGLLGAIESVAGEGSTKTTAFQAGGDPFGNARRETSNSTLESKLERIDPHDLLLRDVLQGLAENDFIIEDPSQAAPGSIVLVSGKLLVLNFETYE